MKKLPSVAFNRWPSRFIQLFINTNRTHRRFQQPPWAGDQLSAREVTKLVSPMSLSFVEWFQHANCFSCCQRSNVCHASNESCWFHHLRSTRRHTTFLNLCFSHQEKQCRSSALLLKSIMGKILRDVHPRMSMVCLAPRNRNERCSSHC